MTPLSEICLAIVDCEHKTAPASSDGTGYPIVRTMNIGRGRLELSNVRRIDSSVYVAWTRRAVPQTGDLILAREAPVGNVAVVTAGIEPALGQRTVLIRPNPEKVDANFLTYRLLAHDIQHWMRGVASGATVPHLNMEDIRALPMPALPELSTQVKIGTALASFDDLIENNRRRIEVLEEMARLLYREWFVHFRFPGHEDVELVDSDLGPIPKGWLVCAVRDVAELVRGRSYRRQDLVEDGGLPFLNLKCIARGGGFRKSGLKRYDGKYKEAQQAYPGDTVIAMTDMTQERKVVGRAARVPALDSNFGIISLDLTRVLPVDSVDRDYLYGMFRFSSFSETVKEHANGTNVLHLSPDRISEYRFIMPPTQFQHSYRTAAKPMHLLVDKLMLQNEVLREGRDLLLPRLVSGELDLSELDLDLDLATV
ncbi:MAG: restriction endonuclease subunit S [Acidimicrobiaceae bacterium]|nr:restriction endonuclease subunit S [Acidimicrobiaceae bacterium]